jgi:hypothetical protein
MGLWNIAEQPEQQSAQMTGMVDVAVMLLLFRWTGNHMGFLM